MDKKYNSLDSYISEEKVLEISKDFNAKVNFLMEKYKDKVIADFIKSIQNADMKNLYKRDSWKYRVEFIAQDINNIDQNKEYSNLVLKEFFVSICKELSVELINYEFSHLSKDEIKVFFIITIKNPMKE